MFLAGLDKVTKKRINIERCFFLGPNAHTQSNSIDNLHLETRPKTVENKKAEKIKKKAFIVRLADLQCYINKFQTCRGQGVDIRTMNVNRRDSIWWGRDIREDPNET